MSIRFQSILNLNRVKLIKRFYSPPTFKSTDQKFKDFTLNLTESALTRLTRLKKNFPDAKLRVAVEAGGCHGFQYKFNLELNEAISDDIIFKDSSDTSLQIICDKVSWSMIKDAKLDFSQELIGSAFRIVDNPVADNGCGCGVSFDLKLNK